MEPFLQYMAGGPCYECGGKTKYADGGESMQSPGSDEQAQKLLQYLTDQMTKGASPSVLKQTLIKSGIPQQSAEQLIKMAAQSFEQRNFQQPENPFEEEGSPQEMRGGGEFLRKMIGGGDLRFKFTGAPSESEVKEWKTSNDNRTQLGMNNFGNESVVTQMQAENPAMYDAFKNQKTIKVTDRNKISNLDNNGFNRSMAFMSGLSNPNSGLNNIPDAGGFGAGLKFLAGAAGALGSAYLGTAKFLAPNKERVYSADKPMPKAYEEGGEWNPFEDNRPKLTAYMPAYDDGGDVTYTGQTKEKEKTPLPFESWAATKEGQEQRTWQAYQDYVKNFKITGAPKVTQRGDNDSKVVAQNMLSGMQMMADSSKYFSEQDRIKEMEDRRRDAGNTMEAASVVNNPNPFGGGYTVNNNLANKGVSMQASDFDLGTTMARYGGMYKEGGSYTVSPEELQMIMALGGDVEFLD